MRADRVRSVVRSWKGALAIAWGALTLLAIAVFDGCFFADTTLAFRFNAASVLFVPSAFFAGTTAAIVWVLTRCRRTDGFRLTVREAMVAIAVLGLALGIARWWVRYHFATVYARGYSESQFLKVRIGMTPREVESILGRPIRKETSPRWP